MTEDRKTEMRELFNILEHIDHHCPPMTVRNFIREYGKTTLRRMVELDWIELGRLANPLLHPPLRRMPINCYPGDEGRIALRDAEQEAANDWAAARDTTFGRGDY